jgi:hypothetical protein
MLIHYEEEISRYILSKTEREELERLIAAGTAPARKLAHARLLLKADQSTEGPGWVDEKVAEAVEVSHSPPRGQGTQAVL